MIIISSALVLSPVHRLSLDHPAIGHHNVVTAAGIVATSYAAGFPPSNLANPATHLEWRAGSLNNHYLTIETDEVDPIDNLAVAGHNFASAGNILSVERFQDGEWVGLVEEVLLANDSPLMFRFPPQSIGLLRLLIQGGAVPARAAVLMCGKLLEIQRKIWVGHTPVPHGRKRVVANNRSESGEFLGRIVLGEGRETTVPLSLIDPDWYREEMDSFLDAAGEDTFFFAWRSETYPEEVGYCWLMDDPMPVPVGPSNLLSFDLKLGGVA